ncbi:hypothetical protein LTR74_006921 [Friedmanniomyces endolithicus]|nr:hypothetical protein LTR74_006921 [Friedmanniomyces endolithicus]
MLLRRAASQCLRKAGPCAALRPLAALLPSTQRSFATAALLRQSAFQQALESNKRWASETAQSDSKFFPTSAQGQSPAILWIGCSDSRVPETTVLGLKPGDVFTHRNIANIVSPTDLSLLSVVEFSVAHLKVKHIVVCGHSKCGGVAGCLANGKLGGSLDIWLQPLRALREKHDAELKGMEVDGQKAFMSAANVRQGVEVMKRIPTVIDAMKERGLQVHGLVYDLASGKLEDVDCDEKDDVAALREAAFERK